MKENKILRRLRPYLIGLSIILFLGSCSKLGSAYKVEYEASGDVAFVSFFGPDGEDSANSPSSPWTYSFKTNNEDQMVSLRVGSSGGSVYAKIYVNGDLVLSASESNGLTAITGTYRLGDVAQ